MPTPPASRRLLPVLVVAVAFALAGCTASASPTPTSAPSTAPSASPAVSASPSPTPAPSPSPTPTAAPTPTPTPAIGLCAPAQLAARITLWDAGAGNRTAHVEVTNSGTSTCRFRTLDRPQLADGLGSVLINGAVPGASTLLTIGPGTVLKTMVQVSNYCGPSPVAPVTVAFVLPGGSARFVATPVSATDLDGVPPCNGAPGSAGDIGMQPWGP
jgi:hypothetical protein